ncbi:MAG: DUF4162 domain-containing protein, partial [Acidimicrobiia bacterium]
ALGTATELKESFGGDRIEVTVKNEIDLGLAGEVLGGFAEGEIQKEDRRPTLVVPITGGAATLTQALRALDQRGVELRDVQLRRPTLDDVFLSITGHLAEEPQTLEEVPA